MSLPKHDPGLAKFITSLDPSMYSISGGESPSAPVAKEVEGLRNDLESRYRETQIREEARNATDIPCRRSKKYLQHLEKNSERIERDIRFRSTPSYINSPLQVQDEWSQKLTIIFHIVVGLVILAGFIYTLFK